MKLLFTLLLSLLLAGCSAPAEAAPTEPVQSPRPVPDSLLQQYGSSVEAAFLPSGEADRLLSAGTGLLAVRENTLTLLDGEFRTIAARTLDFVPEIRVSGNTVCAFDAGTRQLLVLDEALEERRRLTLPPELTGSPVLSSGAERLYYATDSGIYVWELDSGIRRRIREDDRPGLTLVGVHMEDTVLQCRLPEGSRPRDLFLDARTGQLLQELDTAARLDTLEGRYYCTFDSGSVENRIFGNGDTEPAGLFPEAFSAECQFLPQLHGAVTVEEDRLTYYDLETGLLADTLPLRHTPKAIAAREDALILLITEDNQDFLLTWRPAAPSGGKCYTDPWFTADDPDHAGLALCREYAQALSDEYGPEVLIWKEAAATAPWDYTFEEEHRYSLLLSRLQTLEGCLARYPKEVLTRTAEHFGSLKLCLVRSITGIAGEESLSTATGIQFLNGSDAHVVLSAGEYMEQALYHELFHVMETVILSRSSALDRWEELNPAGFSYDLDHGANARRNAGVYLEKETRAFVDTYSMSFPREDRARIFEYAMLDGMEHLFAPKTMQRKLLAVCQGIREAYGLEDSPETFPWEQYLE